MNDERRSMPDAVSGADVTELHELHEASPLISHQSGPVNTRAKNDALPSEGQSRSDQPLKTHSRYSANKPDQFIDQSVTRQGDRTLAIIPSAT
jgi:hypothetical protein